ncbi:ATP-dependent DNA helicase [Paenibacillus oenotherae]|uniref:ATP-dependent DNA helicase n=1 Tax=Paenibacillus oenotherae TaxID=1435645 RepID=A0ABS7D6N6_9BACL|nr:ATP-dependent DNA helicase [Paenibacillus oenotherae]MBW7475176.1 ATP-dependent DNA helicase [Paenibacillus oenotherae]
MPDLISISVRALVEYVYRSGDIEAGFRTSTTLTEGTKAHQRIQKQYNEQDEKEVYLSAEMDCGGLRFIIDGRCDGILMTEAGVTIDEIKSTSMSLANITADRHPVHWAQAKCYAYMAAKERGLGHIHVQLTYVHAVTGEQKRFVAEAVLEELTSFMQVLVKGYYPYAELRTRHERERDRSVKKLAFPFESYREGQRKLAGAVYQSIADGHKLFAKAPTGIGKTISTLFPSIKAIGEGLLKRIFYLTARTITRTAAEEALALMRTKGLHLHAVTITAKEKACLQEEMRCSKEHCPYADGYYDRVNGAILDMLSNETLMGRAVIEQYARKHVVCPFEFALDAAYASDVMIGDYNYIFDPRVSLKRLFEEGKRQSVLLIDEAHNLVDRAREMYSSELRKSDFLLLQRMFKGVHSSLYHAAKGINEGFIKLRKQQGEAREHVSKELPEQLVGLLDSFIAEAEQELAVKGAGGGNELLLDTYYSAASFVRIAKLYDERYVTITACTKSEVEVKLYCLDPSHQLQVMGKGYRSHVLFSATLSPLSYYMDVLGGDPERDYSVSIASPFSREQLEVFIQPLSTRYQDRERSMSPIVDLIRGLTGKRPGNYLVFFPSYEYMNRVYELLSQTAQGMSTIIQRSNMSEEERESFLSAFQANGEGVFAGFAVMGGMFSEGIDLVGDRLNGVIIVGVGLPQLCLERNIIRDYYNARGKSGYDYAYVMPGMNKVLQAGGRLIRSEHDRGSLLLIDDRYLQPQYHRLLPAEWQGSTILQPSER